VQSTGQNLVNALSFINGMVPCKFIMADDAGLEMSRAQRDSVLAPVLAASGLVYTKQYYLDRFDLLEDDLEEKEDEEVMPMDESPITSQESLDDNGERKEPTRDRSVADED
jgi:hypothetical protein